MSNLSLPQRGLQSGGCLLTNFDIIHARPLYDISSCTQLEAIDLRIAAPDCTRDLIVDIRQSISSQILNAIPTCRILNAGSYGSVDTHILYIATASKDQGLFCRDFGLNQLYDGTWIFVAGDEILGNRSNHVITVHPEISSIHLARDGPENEQSAIIMLLREIEHNPPIIWPTFSYSLLCSMRPQVAALGLTTFPALYIVGQQGFGTPEQVSIFLDFIEKPYAIKVRGHKRIDDTGLPYTVGDYVITKSIPEQVRILFKQTRDRDNLPQCGPL